MIQIEICEQLIQLLPERAAFWSHKKILVISDIHLGKAAAMQRAGIAVPEGAMDNDLGNLKALIDEYKVERCIIVGDLIHAKTGLSERVQNKFKEWLSGIPCSIELVLGNHDKALIKQLPEGWNLHVHQEDLTIAPFCFSHFPKSVNPFFVWSGHLHPQFLLKSRHDQLTLRCFHLTACQGILPAFSDFVGGSYVKKCSASQVYVIAQNQVIKI